MKRASSKQLDETNDIHKDFKIQIHGVNNESQSNQMQRYSTLNE